VAKVCQLENLFMALVQTLKDVELSRCVTAYILIKIKRT